MMNWFAKLPLVEKVGWSVPIAIFLGVVLVLCYVGILEWPKLRALDSVKDRVGLELEFIKTAAQILGGAFFLFGLYFTWANLVATKEKNQADLKMAQEKQITELYVKAIEQLGGKTLEVRLGGIYALERIARDSEKDHWPIMEVLTAYVRENAPWPPEEFAVAKEKRPWARERPGEKPKEKGASAPGKGEAEEPAAIPKLDADIQAVLTVIGRRSPTFGKGEAQPLDLIETDLRRAYLREAHLEKAYLYNSHLEGAYLREAHLDKAVLGGAHLEGAVLVGARLEGADLSRGAHLEGAHLKYAHLERADLRGAHLEGADLRGAHLEGANLWFSHLEGAVLYEAHLERADLIAARGLTQKQIDMAYCDEKTKLPLGLKCSEKKEPAP